MIRPVSIKWSLLGLALVACMLPAPALAMQMNPSVGATLLGFPDVKVDMTGMDPGEEGICLGGGDMCIAQTSNYLVPLDEVQKRDLYLWSQMLEIDGVLDGDLIAWVQNGRIAGTVTEDVAAFAQELRISGEVDDDVRAFCQNLYIDGTVKGDVMALAANITVSENAVIEGNLLAAGGVMLVNGTVMQDVTLAGGTVAVNGTIGGNANLRTDGGLTVGPNASIGGDLKYKGPSEIEIAPGVVKGNVNFERPAPKVHSGFGFPKGLRIFLWIFEFIAAIIAGSVIVALTKDHARRTAETIKRKPLKSLGIGFIAFICIPIIVLIALVLIVTAPLSIILALGYVIALYIAKFYVAIWLGNMLIGRNRRPDASPVPTMLLGLVIIYAVTAIPVAGTLIGIVIMFFGLGALLQRKGTRLNGAFEAPPASPQGLPDAFPGSPAPTAPTTTEG